MCSGINPSDSLSQSQPGSLSLNHGMCPKWPSYSLFSALFLTRANRAVHYIGNLVPFGSQAHLCEFKAVDMTSLEQKGAVAVDHGCDC